MEGCFKELMRAEGGEPETGNHPRDLCFRGSSIAIRDTICSVQVGQETQSVIPGVYLGKEDRGNGMQISQGCSLQSPWVLASFMV